jgi:Skp family chaperone for outer membrane proteins
MKIVFSRKTLILFLLVSLASPVMGAINSETVIDNPREARAIELQTRLEEIKAMDKTDLTRTEKKELRHEVRKIKKELATKAGGVYLSVGAIILIALLLILLL